MRQVQPQPTKPMQMQMERTTTDEELDELPPMDGDSDDPSEPEIESLDDADELASEAQDALDPFDDSTGEAEPVEELVEEERSWLADAEPAEGVELGAFDFEADLPSIQDGGGSAIGDDEEPGVDGEDFGIEDSGGAPVLLDGGEEGPSGPDEELREADLPALDADEEGDLDDALLDDVALDDDAPLPWDPSPWERVPVDHEQPSLVAAEQDLDVQEKHEKTLAALGLTKKAADLRVTAEAAANGDRLVALLSRIAGRAWLVRVTSTGPRIVAEVGGAAFGDEPEILAISWDEARGVAWVSGPFGLLAFQPAERHLT
ncbi:hypothetical protein LVJ94_18710 [Pendulispora rubella]|uniref:Uncharacterized protein n=1 Tax=Pendulispora rubella TaxID=2741070 RepID=A0ABZ2LI78_9BACT